jgi:hypothetical protein
MKNTTKLLGCFLCLVFLVFGAQAHALLIITPATGPHYEGNQTSQAEIDAWIAANIGDLDVLYKQDVGGGESGPLAGSYKTEFFNSPTDPEDALITYEGGPIAGDPTWLLVKDGNQEPAWYMFELIDELGWNGTEDIELLGFWPDQGAISHVSLYGSETSVPEPATMLLLGTGLIGLAFISRRRLKE